MTINIGVIGAGVYGTHVLDVLNSASEEVKLKISAICDINPDTLKAAVEKYGANGYLNYKEMMDKEKLDAVAIVTPDHLHRDIAIEAAQRKLHILCQKPIATESGEAKEMIDAANKNSVMLYVDFHKRFDPGHMTLKKHIKEGKLGDILYGEVCMEDRIEVPAVWFKSWAGKSSPAWFLGVHFYDLVYWLIESKPVKVFSHGVKKKLLSMGIDTYDFISSQVIYENGTSFIFNVSWILPDNFPSIVNQQIKIVGTEGICEIDSQDRGMFSSYTKDISCQIINPFSKYMVVDMADSNRVSGYTCESIIYFTKLLKMIKEGKKLEDLKGKYPDGEQAIISTILCEAVHESIEKNKVVELS